MEKTFNIKLPNFSQCHILVVGDVMLDRYWYGDTSRISPEAPVPVVHVKQREDRPGGAANVALNVRTLGAKVTLIGAVGHDSAGQELELQLKNAGIHCLFQKLNAISTITKLRVISRHQQLVRLDFEQPMFTETKELLNSFKKSLQGVHGIIFSDYHKGALAHIQEMMACAQQANIPTFVDPKSADFSIYQGATVITPNLKEFQTAVGECANEKDLLEKGRELIKTYEFNAVLITKGEHGMSLIEKGTSEVHLPTRAQEVFDVTGAGDTVIATLAAANVSGCSLVEAMYLANTAAGIAVSKLGVATVSIPELRAVLHRERSALDGVMTEGDLLVLVAEAKAQGKKIVMTNGCFDILHAGHVHYLEQAKQWGDYLIVAVNDDASVKRLKGSSRPFNPLETRMAVLAGLAAVDWVVSFSEDTPERLISTVLPDVLVKGGDYKVEEIAGNKAVLANGGRVEILGFVEGLSTSKLINKIQKDQEK